MAWCEAKRTGGAILVICVVLGCLAIVAKCLGWIAWPWAWTLSPFWFILVFWLITLVIASLDWKD